MFDVFYIGKKPGVFPHEMPVNSLGHAAELCRTRYCWIITYLVQYSQWDWLWEPPPWQAHQRHAWFDQFGNDSQTYLVAKSGWSDTNYHTDQTLVVRTDPECWVIPDYIDPNSIDKSWAPNTADPPYVYEFPVEWGWDHIGGPEYHVPGATARKYVTDFITRTRPDPNNFKLLDNLDFYDDVFRWRPNPADPPYIYVFGNQWWPAEKKASAVYQVPGAQETKYISDPRAQRLPCHDNYVVNVAESEFDFSWEPDPGDPPYIYVFGNQWWGAEIMPTVEYHVPGATERKFMDYPRARVTSTNDELWHMITASDWDRTWLPDPGDPPYIYVFGNQWWPPEIMPTVEYHVPGATERKFLQEPRAQLPQDRRAWSVPDDVNADVIDYSWQPDPGSPPYIYHFGTEHQASVGVTYTVSGAHEIKFAGDIPLRDQEPTAMIALDSFYIDFSNALSSERFLALQKTLPDLQRVRYVNSLMDTIKRCSKRAKTPRFWVLSSQNDYTGFDFSWHPEIWQRGMIHVFGTQWNKWSDTFLINRWEFDRQSPWQSRLEDFYNLNFVENQRVTAATDAADIIVIDHGNTERDRVTQDLESRSGRVVRRGRYFDNYLDTLRRVIDDSITAPHVWICSTLCDYSRFDFSWQPEAWQRDMIHVFASGDNKFGDTFLVPVQAWRDQQAKLELLEWFDTVNYVPDLTVPRWPMPVIKHDQDTHVKMAMTAEFSGPLLMMSVAETSPREIPAISLWREQTRTIMPLDPGAESVIVPRSAIPYIKTQFYDYPYIDKTQRHLQAAAPLDIVFVSNGEPNAEENYQILRNRVAYRSNLLHRVDGVNGRAAAYHAAAQVSTTPWFFAVFAKLCQNTDFDWSWQPDRMQQPKHYIFHARNPVNDLVYGHQAMIAYNRALVLANPGVGLDFTLDSPHETVPILSGVARYNTSAWSTWRTAFREVIKLRASLPDVENEYRINCWCANGTAEYAEWSARGAQDALAYYDEVRGDFTELRKSYEWSWLASYALLRRNLTPNQ
jgi:hypothetical protein